MTELVSAGTGAEFDDSAGGESFSPPHGYSIFGPNRRGGGRFAWWAANGAAGRAL